MIDWIDVVDEKCYLMAELNAGRLDRERWLDFIAFAEKVGCPAMAEGRELRADG